jgi:hypothetical protein
MISRCVDIIFLFLTGKWACVIAGLISFVRNVHMAIEIITMVMEYIFIILGTFVLM